TSQFYATPTNIVLGRIIAGGPVPASLEEFADMVAQEAKFAAMVDFGVNVLTGKATATGEPTGQPGEQLPGPTGEGSTGSTRPAGGGGRDGGEGGGKPPGGGSSGDGGGGPRSLFPGLSDAEVDAAFQSSRSGTMAEG